MSLDFLKEEEGVEEIDVESERESTPKFLPTDVYDAIIKLAYLDEAQSKAKSINVLYDINGKTIRQTEYITSGEAKGCKNYYVTKDGDKRFLPGYQKFKNLIRLVADKELSSVDVKTKAIPLWDYETSQEILQDKQVIMDLIGKNIKVAIKHVKDYKQAKNSEGNWVDTDEIREFNEVATVFNYETGANVLEQIKGEEPKAMNTWIEKNKDKVSDRTKGKTPVIKSDNPFAEDGSNSSDNDDDDLPF